MAIVLVLVIVATLSRVQASEREDLIAVATQEIKGLGMPYTTDYEIDYDATSQRLTVAFVTSPKFKWNYNLFYLLWWDCQFIELNHL